MRFGLGSQTPGSRPGGPDGPAEPAPQDQLGRLIMGGQTLAYILGAFFLIIALSSARRDRN